MKLFFLLGIGWALAAAASAAPVLVNGSFETGDFTGWTATGPMSVSTNAPFDGTFNADYNATNTAGPAIGTLSQTLATTIGANYIISFAVRGNTPNNRTFSADFGGTNLLTIGPPWLGFAYTVFTIPVTATSASTLLSFTFTEPAPDTATTRFDFVTIADASAPELDSTRASLPILVAFMLLAMASRRGTSESNQGE